MGTSTYNRVFSLHPVKLF